MDSKAGSKGWRRWGLAAMGFGAILSVGALGEIGSVAFKGLLPAEAYAVPFMAKHQTALGLRGWVFCSNLVNLACAVAFLLGGVRLLRGENGWPRIATAALGLFCTTLLSVPVCAWYFFPMPSGAARSESIVLAVSMAGAAGGLLMMTTLWRSAALRRIA
jgi:hypothetical protein